MTESKLLGTRERFLGERDLNKNTKCTYAYPSTLSRELRSGTKPKWILCCCRIRQSVSSTSCIVTKNKSKSSYRFLPPSPTFRVVSEFEAFGSTQGATELAGLGYTAKWNIKPVQICLIPHHLTSHRYQPPLSDHQLQTKLKTPIAVSND